MLFGWQGTLVGQSGLLQSDKEIYGEKEMKREREIVLGVVCVCCLEGLRFDTGSVILLLANHIGLSLLLPSSPDT